MTDKYGLVKRVRVTGEEMGDVNRLIEVGNRYEGLCMPMDWYNQHRSGAEMQDFLYYEDGMLVGYLTTFGFGSYEREITGMVHPEYRRRGIFGSLLAEARAEWAGSMVEDVVFVCERASSSGQAYIAHIGAQHDYSEHLMRLTEFHERAVFDDRLHFRVADKRDLEGLTKITAASFHGSVDGTRSVIQRRLEHPEMRYYLLIFGDNETGCREPVGCLRVHDRGSEASLHGIGVHPDYQGRGYGRYLIEETIRLLRARHKKDILLEVDVDNPPAFNLYRSLGFEIVTTYDYYRCALRNRV